MLCNLSWQGKWHLDKVAVNISDLYKDIIIHHVCMTLVMSVTPWLHWGFLWLCMSVSLSDPCLMNIHAQYYYTHSNPGSEWDDKKPLWAPRPILRHQNKQWSQHLKLDCTRQGDTNSADLAALSWQCHMMEGDMQRTGKHKRRSRQMVNVFERHKN